MELQMFFFFYSKQNLTSELDFKGIVSILTWNTAIIEK